MRGVSAPLDYDNLIEYNTLPKIGTPTAGAPIFLVSYHVVSLTVINAKIISHIANAISTKFKLVECHNPYFPANIVQIKSRIGDPDYLGWWKSIILGRGGGGLEG